MNEYDHSLHDMLINPAEKEPIMHRIKLDRTSVLHVLIWTLAALIMVDVVITYAGTSWFGMTEGNPLFYLLGMGWFMVAKIVISAGLLYGIWHMRNHHPVEYPLGTLTVLYFAVAVNNLIVVGWA